MYWLWKTKAIYRTCYAQFWSLQNAKYRGIAALEQLEKDGPPDLIFLDLMMPLMDGTSFMQAVRKQEKYKNVPVVVISGDANVRDLVDELNMDVFIAKPFSINEILDYVVALLGEPVQM